MDKIGLGVPERGSQSWRQKPSQVSAPDRLSFSVHTRAICKLSYRRQFTYGGSYEDDIFLFTGDM